MVAFLYYTSFDSLTYYFGFSTIPPPPPTTPLEKNNNLILFELKNLNEKIERNEINK